MPVTDWTVDTLREHFNEVIAAADRRYQERFEAQHDAIAAALASANRIADQLGTTDTLREEVARLGSLIKSLGDLTEAKFVTYRALIESQAEKVALALSAADKAVQKAETATEKRFEGVNEFRQQLADQAGTFMPRAEAEARTGQNTEKIGDLNTRISELDKRVAEISSRTGGHQDSTKNLVTIIGLVLTAVTVIVGAYLAFHK